MEKLLKEIEKTNQSISYLSEESIEEDLYSKARIELYIKLSTKMLKYKPGNYLKNEKKN